VSIGYFPIPSSTCNDVINRLLNAKSDARCAIFSDAQARSKKILKKTGCYLSSGYLPVYGTQRYQTNTAFVRLGEPTNNLLDLILLIDRRVRSSVDLLSG